MARRTEMYKALEKAIRDKITPIGVARYNGELEDLMQQKSVVAIFPFVRILIPNSDDTKDAGNGAREFSTFRKFLIQIIVMDSNIRSLDELAMSLDDIMDDVEDAISGDNLGLANAQAITPLGSSMEDGSFLNNIIAYILFRIFEPVKVN